MIKFYLTGGDISLQNGKTVIKEDNQYTLTYPCGDSYECKNFVALFPPGKYLIKLYGGSGGHEEGHITSAANLENDKECIDQSTVDLYGGNVKCTKISSMTGAGGYTSGTLTLHEITKVYIAIGGKGQYKTGEAGIPYDDSNMAKGGYNGGGKGNLCAGSGSGGGGATDIRLLKDDLWHRIMVAGGGGGHDNPTGTFREGDDGSGGAGGGEIAQGFWIDGVYNGDYLATQTSGFTFGNGESAQDDGSKNEHGILAGANYCDRPGAGGGWFGGFASHNGNGGSGGGSSFVFTANSNIYEGNITEHNSNYDYIDEKPYAFQQELDYKYFITNPVLIQGIWDGNGKAIITYLPLIYCSCHNFLLTRNTLICLITQIFIL